MLKKRGEKIKEGTRRFTLGGEIHKADQPREAALTTRLQAVGGEDTLDTGSETTGGSRAGDGSAVLVVEAEDDGATLGLETRCTLAAHLELSSVVVAGKSKVLLTLEGGGGGAPGVGLLELLGDAGALGSSCTIAGGGSKESAISADEKTASKANASDLRKPCVPTAHLCSS